MSKVAAMMYCTWWVQGRGAMVGGGEGQWWVEGRGNDGMRGRGNGGWRGRSNGGWRGNGGWRVGAMMG